MDRYWHVCLMACILSVSHCLGSEAQPTETFTWRVSNVKPVVITSPDHTPFRVTVIAAESTPVKVNSTKNVKVIDGNNAPVEATEDRSVTASGKGKQPVIIESPGDNILTIKNGSIDNDTVTLSITATHPDALKSPFRVAVDDSKGKSANGPVIMNVASSDVIPLPSFQIEEAQAGAPTIGLLGISLLTSSLAIIGGIFLIAFLHRKKLLHPILSNGIYLGFEALRRISYRAYAKVFASEPRRIL